MAAAQFTAIGTHYEVIAIGITGGSGSATPRGEMAYDRRAALAHHWSDAQQQVVRRLNPQKRSVD
jgi:hypothetical protein